MEKLHSNLNHPLISIIIPVYNGSNYIDKALESCLKQTYENIEIIVVNDGSTDDGLTENTIKPFLADHRVKYYLKPNGGTSSALNFGIKNSKGDFISWLSHDDLFSPDKIEKQVVHTLKNKNIISYTKTTPISSNGGKLSFFKRFFVNQSILKHGTIHGGEDYFRRRLPFYSALLVPRNFLISHPFNCNLKYGQDNFSIFQLLIDSNYSFKRCKNGISFYRIHNMSSTFTRVNDYNNEQEIKNKLFLEYILKNKKRKKLLKLYYLCNCRLAGHYDINLKISNSLIPYLKREYKSIHFIIFRGKLKYHLFKFLWKIKRALISK